SGVRRADLDHRISTVCAEAAASTTRIHLHRTQGVTGGEIGDGIAGTFCRRRVELVARIDERRATAGRDESVNPLAGGGTLDAVRVGGYGLVVRSVVEAGLQDQPDGGAGGQRIDGEANRDAASNGGRQAGIDDAIRGARTSGVQEGAETAIDGRNAVDGHVFAGRRRLHSTDGPVFRVVGRTVDGDDIAERNQLRAVGDVERGV